MALNTSNSNGLEQLALKGLTVKSITWVQIVLLELRQILCKSTLCPNDSRRRRCIREAYDSEGEHGRT